MLSAAGLAGTEAAWQAASLGVPVILHEMRPVRGTDAHKTESLAELVCSNSFRSDDALNNAVGLLHEEMRRMGSLVLSAADKHKLPAGGALAVDREGFAAEITARIAQHPLIEILREEIAAIPPPSDSNGEWDNVVIATGPLTSPDLAQAILALTGGNGVELLRRDRADRAQGQHRFRQGLVPVALRPGRPGRRRGGLHQLPAQPGRIRRVLRSAAGRREDRLQGMGENDTLFRGLPADRG